MKLTDYRDYSRTEWESLIDEWIFSEMARNMLRRRLLDERTLEQISEEFDRSVTQTKRIIYKAEEKLFRHI